MGSTEPAGVYRPRHPRESALYRLTEEHLETFKQVYDELSFAKTSSGRTSTTHEW